MAGGLLLRHRQQGDETCVGYLTDGRYGGEFGDPEKVAEQRHDEARAACEYLGARMFWGGLEDGFLLDTPLARKVCTDIIRSAKPDLIVTHAPDDYHPDHVSCYSIVRAANALASTSGFRSAEPATPHLASMWLMDNLGQLNPRATIFIDIEQVMAKKMELLAKHASHLRWMMAQGVDLPSLVWKQAAVRGEQSRAILAEAFEPAMKWGLQQTSMLFGTLTANREEAGGASEHQSNCKNMGGA
jgi:LmbE family N-acetylglucosaminyl deacetylase